MTSTTQSPPRRTRRAAVDTPGLEPSDRLALMRYLLLHRLTEERGLKLYKQGKIPGSFYDGRGQEAVSVGATYALAGADPVCPLIRDLGAHLVKGTDLEEIFAHYLGRENELSHGREGNIHFGDRRVGVVGAVSMLPKMMVVATGMALAFKMRGEQRCALSFFGDGSTSNGDWHEAMNFAGVHRLPVIFVLENNLLAYSTPQAKQFVVSPVHRAEGYGFPGVSVDGNDVEAVFGAVRDARLRALSGAGPTLVEANTMRMHGHGAHDDMKYVDAGLLEQWLLRDPIEAYAKVLGAEGVDVDAVRTDVLATVEAAVAAALQRPMPAADSAGTGVFCTEEPEPVGVGASPWSHFAEAA